MPLRIIPDLSEAPEHDVQSARAKLFNVLDNGPFRLGFFDDAEEFEPQPGSGPSKPGSTSIDADVLARETSAEDIHSIKSICPKLFSAEGSDIFVLSNIGPVFSQNASAEFVSLTESDGFVSACPVQPEAEHANAAKEIEDTKRLLHLKISLRATDETVQPGPERG